MGGVIGGLERVIIIIWDSSEGSIGVVVELVVRTTNLHKFLTSTFNTV